MLLLLRLLAFRPIFLHPLADRFTLSGRHRAALTAPGCGSRVRLVCGSWSSSPGSRLPAQVWKHPVDRFELVAEFLNPRFRSTAGEGFHVELCQVVCAFEEDRSLKRIANARARGG